MRSLFKTTTHRELGNSVAWDCRATGIPLPVVYWTTPPGDRLVNGTSNASRARLQDTAVAGTLFIDRLQPTDAGVYRCTAVNDEGRDVLQTVLKLYSRAARVLPLAIDADSITVTWNGTDSTIRTADYVMVYRRLVGDPTASDAAAAKSSATERGRVRLRPFMRKQSVNGLHPGTVYEFCMAYQPESGRAARSRPTADDDDLIRISCVNITTRLTPMLADYHDGIHSGSPTALTAFVSVVLVVTGVVLLCVLATVVKRYRRRKYYDEPNGNGTVETALGRRAMGSLSSDKIKVDVLSQIPLDNLYHPACTPITTSRTSLVGAGI